MYDTRQSPTRTRNPSGTPESVRTLLFGAFGSAATLSMASRMSWALAGWSRRKTLRASRPISTSIEEIRIPRTEDQLKCFLPSSGGALRADDADTEQFPRRPRRARPFRHLWRTLRRRNLDAAGACGRGGLRRGPRRSGVSGRARLLPRTLCRAAESLIFRRAADQAFRRRQALSKARRAQPYRRAQDQQCAGPGIAGAADEEAPHHRRDRSRPARGGD